MGKIPQGPSSASRVEEEQWRDFPGEELLERNTSGTLGTTLGLFSPGF